MVCGLRAEKPGTFDFDSATVKTKMESDYRRLADDTRDTLMAYAQQEWTVSKTSHDIQLSSLKHSDLPVKIFKATSVVNLPPVKTFELISITPGQTKRKIQKSIKSWEVLKEVEEGVFILRSVSNSALSGAVDSREFLDLVGNYSNWGGSGVYISSATGIEYPFPEDRKLVRGFNYPSGIVCFPLADHPEKTKVVYIINTDLKGRLPQKLVNAVLPDLQLTFFKGLHRAVAEELQTS